MKILYLSPNGFLGGAENVVLNLCQEHQKAQIDYKIIFFRNGKAVEKAKLAGLNHQVLGHQFKFRRPWKLFQAILEIRIIAKTFSTTHLHCTMPYSYIVGFLATIFLPVKRIWFQHGPVGNIYDKVAVHLPVDMILFNSSYLMEAHHQLSALWTFPHQEKIVHLGVEKKLPLSPVEITKNQNEFLCLLVGRIAPIKGQDVAIASLSHLTRYKGRVKLVIVGDMEGELYLEYKNHLRELIKKYNLENAVIFVGEKSNVQDYYQACDITLMTTTVPEAFGMVIAESMIYSTLVLGNKLGGAADLLIEGRTGFIYDSTLSNSDELLAAKLEQVFMIMENSPEEIIQIKKNASMLIAGHHSLKNFHQEIIDLYQSLS